MAEVQHSSTTTEHRSDYWDEYYAARATTRRPLPSQFATFVAGELDRPHRVIELGLRQRPRLDLLRLLRARGHRRRRLRGRRRGLARTLAEALGEKATFIHSAIDDPDLADRLSASEGPQGALRPVLHPRDHRRGGAGASSTSPPR